MGILRELGERRIRLLGMADPHALAVITSALEGRTRRRTRCRSASNLPCAARSARAIAATRPLVLCLDDVHWADVASVDALAALVRRPPAAQVLIALAAREAQLPSSLARAVAAAMVEDRVARVEVSQLSRAEAEQLVGGGRGDDLPVERGQPVLPAAARARPARRAGDGTSAGCGARACGRGSLAVQRAGRAFAADAALDRGGIGAR